MFLSEGEGQCRPMLEYFPDVLLFGNVAFGARQDDRLLPAKFECFGQRAPQHPPAAGDDNSIVERRLTD